MAHGVKSCHIENMMICWFGEEMETSAQVQWQSVDAELDVCSNKAK
jgi:hypothetical protein